MIILKPISKIYKLKIFRKIMNKFIYGYYQRKIIYQKFDHLKSYQT